MVHIPDKGLVSRIYKKKLINNKGNQKNKGKRLEQAFHKRRYANGQ